MNVLNVWMIDVWFVPRIPSLFVINVFRHQIEILLTVPVTQDILTHLIPQILPSYSQPQQSSIVSSVRIPDVNIVWVISRTVPPVLRLSEVDPTVIVLQITTLILSSQIPSRISPVRVVWLIPVKNVSPNKINVISVTVWVQETYSPVIVRISPTLIPSSHQLTRE